MQSIQNQANFSEMAERWPSPYVAREKVAILTGGITNPRTLANLDSKGEGPPGRVRVGRKIAYPVKGFIKWLESRAVMVG